MATPKHLARVPEVITLTPSTYAMAAANTGYCGRFKAAGTRDIKSVWVNWQTITAAGTITLTVEGIDLTTGDPDGSVNDAAATVTAAPTAGWQNFAFASTPTTGLTDGTDYGVVLITATLGTAHTLNAHVNLSHVTSLPTTAATAADGTTRSNFAEVANCIPVMYLVYDDDSI